MEAFEHLEILANTPESLSVDHNVMAYLANQNGGILAH